MKRIILFFLIFCNGAVLFSLDRTIDKNFSLDLGYSLIGFENNGWGLGVNFEHIVIDHLALKYGLGHMTFKTNLEELYCTTVNLSMMANYYFLNTDLQRLYFGSGLTTDFLNYFGEGVIPDQTNDTILYLDSVLGWKQVVFSFLMLDMSLGYNLIISDAENYPSFAEYGKGGFFYTNSFKFLIN